MAANGAHSTQKQASQASQHSGQNSSDHVCQQHESQPTPPPNNKKKGQAKKQMDPTEVDKLVAAKISQLENDVTAEEEEERSIARAVKKANKELAELVNSREDHLAKVEAISQKYSELLNNMKRLEHDHSKTRKRADQLQKEKDQIRSDHTKTVTIKHKLETLCRELQKENKRIKGEQEESKRMQLNETKKRDELSDKFEQTIWEIKHRMEAEESASKNPVITEVDEMFKAKFKSFVDQYELRELHFISVLRHKELEVQYHQSRYEHQRRLVEQESARAKALHAQVSTFSQTEKELRSQLNIYVDKFKQVEDTLNNSNDLFLTFRKEMEEMSKKTKRLEKENLSLTKKSEAMNRNIIEMAEERTKNQKELEMLRKKNQKLENLCRALQQERNTLQNRLQGIEISDEEGDEEDEDEECEDDEGEYEDEDDLGSDEEYEDEGHEHEHGPMHAPEDDETEDEMEGSHQTYTTNGTSLPSSGDERVLVNGEVTVVQGKPVVNGA